MKKRILVLLIALMALTASIMPVCAASNAVFTIVEMHQKGDAITMYLTRFTTNLTSDNRTYSKDQYTVQIGNESVTPDSAQGLRDAKGTIHYILLIDISKSISGKSKNGNVSERETLNRAVQGFLGNLEDNEYVTLIPIGNSSKMEDIRFREKKRDEVAGKTEIVCDADYTHMYEAIVTGATVYNSNPEKYDRTALIMITDGTDDYTNNDSSKKNADHTTLEEARSKIAETGVPFYTLIFERDKGNQSDIQKIVSASFGYYQTINTANLSEKLVSLQNITRQSSKLVINLLQDPDAPKTGIIPMAVKVQTTGGETTAERRFNVDWSKVNNTREPEDLYLDSLRVPEVTEDDTEIRILTEAGATVTFSQNNRELAQAVADENGEAIWKFDKSKRFKPGDKLRIYAVDAKGNYSFDKDKRGEEYTNPCDIEVISSPRADITVSLPESVVKADYEYFGSTLSMTLKGEPAQEVEITWEAEEVGKQTFIQQLQNNGALTLRLDFDQMNGTELSEITGGNVVVVYADGLGASIRGESEGSITWHRDVPVELKEISIEASGITEDDEEIRISTEPGSEVIFSKGSRELYRETTANGSLTWHFGRESRFEQGDEIVVTAVHPNGVAPAEARIVISPSSRRAIEVSLTEEASVKLPDDAARGDNDLFGANLVLKIYGEPNQKVLLIWSADNTADYTIEDQLKSNGILSRKISFAELNGEDVAEITGGVLQVSYLDGYGKSLTGYTDLINWHRDLPEAKDTSIDVPVETSTLSEDSVSWTLHTEAGATVVVTWPDGQQVTNTADDNGFVVYDVPPMLKKGEEIALEAVDIAGNSTGTVHKSIAESSREQISIDPIQYAVVSDELKVRGRAEKNQRIVVTWTPANNSENYQKKTCDANSQGIFSTTFDMSECELGEGYISAEYEDGRGYSMRGRTSGAVVWNEPTPEPTVTPTPVPPTPTPTITPTPTPSPTIVAEPSIPPSEDQGLMDKVRNILDVPEDASLWSSPRFIFVIVVLVLLIALIVVLIILQGRRRSNKGGSIQNIVDRDEPRIDHINNAAETIRKVDNGSQSSGTPGVHETLPRASTNKPVQSTGTVNMHQEAQRSGSGTIRIGQDAPLPSQSGTVRIDRSMQPLELTFEESHEANGNLGERRIGIVKEIIVGRQAPANFVVNDESVSSRHLKIEREDNLLFVEDTNSTNGTMLNGELLTMRRPLKDGDRLTIGRTTLVIHYQT